ncbi:unnamed protein product [Heterosigma akashiwo]
MFPTAALLMAKKGGGKAATVGIKLVSSAGTGFFYRTTKNPRNVPEKLQLMKYDPVVRKHVLFTEHKLK